MAMGPAHPSIDIEIDVAEVLRRPVHALVKLFEFIPGWKKVNIPAKAVHNHLSTQRRLFQDGRSIRRRIYIFIQSIVQDFVREGHGAFHAVRISGAMTNVVLKVTNCMEGTSVIVRMFGPTTALFDRKTERCIFLTASEIGIGAKCLVEFGNGRVEECLPGSAISPGLMRSPGHASAIAAELARFHVLMSSSKLISDGILTNPDGVLRGTLWNRLRTWLAAVQAVAPKEVESMGLQRAETEIDEMSRHFEKHAWLAVCHNDLQYGNILSLQDEDRDFTSAACKQNETNKEGGDRSPPINSSLTESMDASTNPVEREDEAVWMVSPSPVKVCLIDYEYSQVSDIGFDIANHFTEYAADYSREDDAVLDWNLLPNEEEKMNFCLSYMGQLLSCFRESPLTAVIRKSVHSGDESTDEASREVRHGNGAAKGLDCHPSNSTHEERTLWEIEAAARMLMHRATAFMKVSHLHWGLWGILVSKSSMADEVEFNYIKYAAERVKQYHQCG